MSIAEVAKLAGVSNATISRVINEQSGVAPTTAANVRRIMKEIGYEPPVKRRGPKRGSQRSTSVTNVLFLIFAESVGAATTGFQRLTQGISTQLDASDINLTIKFVSGSEEARKLNLANPRVDGILAHGSAPPSDALEGTKSLPTVWLMSNATRPTWGDQVMPDNQAVGYLAARHLVDSGRRRLAYLNLLPDHWALQLHGTAFTQAANDFDATAE
ncbi:MAG: LacI family DNA-binding transcriptional regulator [Planctomycetota bacterium]